MKVKMLRNPGRHVLEKLGLKPDSDEAQKLKEGETVDVAKETGEVLVKMAVAEAAK